MAVAFPSLSFYIYISKLLHGWLSSLKGSLLGTKFSILKEFKKN
jgi:hypothetical protein